MKSIRTPLSILILCFILLPTKSISAPDFNKLQNYYSLTGFIKKLETVKIEKIEGKWQTMSCVQNRFDLRIYPTSTITAHFGMRNIFDYGQIPAENYPEYADMETADNGFWDLTNCLAKDTSYVLYTNFDRAYIEFSRGNLEVVFGRQRINWEINQIWNPNDIFNTFNYFNFDYSERPGCDGVKFQYYLGMTSSAEFAYKIDKEKKITWAGMFKFNKWSYDFQFLSGVMEEDLVIGSGWSGQIGKAGFNGEISYFTKKNELSNSIGLLIGSWGGNYGFANGLFLQTAILYNSKGTTGPAASENVEITAKSLTRAKYNLFGSTSYPLTPLFKITLSAMLNPNDSSSYLGPSLDLSLTQNLDLKFQGQIYYGDEGTEFGDWGKMFFFRLKWSF